MIKVPEKTFTLSANIEIDLDDDDVFDVRKSLNNYEHPLSKERLDRLVSTGVLPQKVLKGIIVINKVNGCRANLVVRTGRYSAKIPRKLKKKLLPRVIREKLSHTWKSFCRLQFLSTIDHFVDAKIGELNDKAIEQLMQAEDKHFLDFASKAGLLVGQS
jgi:hypothetical protein